MGNRRRRQQYPLKNQVNLRRIESILEYKSGSVADILQHSLLFSYFLPRTKLVFLHNISSPIKYDKISSTVQQGSPLRPPNINIIAHLLFSVNSPDIQTFPLLFMKVPILQKGRTVGIIKLPQRSETNVQVNLKTTESEVTKNAGTQQLHEVTPRIVGIIC